MQQILLAVQILVAVSVIVMVLLQQGRGADAGASFGGGSSGSLFGSRGPASFLAKITAILALVFFLNSLALAYFAARSGRDGSLLERVAVPADTAAPALESATEVPSAPSAESGSSDSDLPTAPADTAPADANTEGKAETTTN